VGMIGFPETSVQNYHYTLRNIPEERRSHLHRGGSLKSRRAVTAFGTLFLASGFLQSHLFCDTVVVCILSFNILVLQYFVCLSKKLAV
jgi:hypothetical protein